MTTVNIFEKRKLRNYVSSDTLSNFDRFYRVDYQKRTVSVNVFEIQDGIKIQEVNLVIPKGWTLDIVQKLTADVFQLSQKIVFNFAVSLGLLGDSSLVNLGNISINQVITVTNVNQADILSPLEALFIQGIATEEFTEFINQGVITTQGKFILGKNTSQLESKKRILVFLSISPIADLIDNQGIIATFVPEHPGYSQAELNTYLTNPDNVALAPLYMYNVPSLAGENSGTVLLIPPIRLDPCRCQLQILPHLYNLNTTLSLNLGDIISYASGFIESATTKPQIKIPRGWNQVVRLTTVDLQTGQEVDVFRLPPNVTNSALALQYQFQQQIRQVPCCYWDIQAIRRQANRYQNFLGKTTPIPNPGPQQLDNDNNSNRQLTRRVRGSLARRLQDRVLGKKEEGSDDDSEFDWGAEPPTEAKSDPQPPTEPEAEE